MNIIQQNLEEKKIFNIIEVCSIFYDFDILKITLSSSFSSEDLFKHFLRTYAGARPRAPKQFYLLAVQFVSEYGFDVDKIRKQLKCFLPNMKKSYNPFETNYQNKNIKKVWDSVYQAIKTRDFEKAYFNLCDLKGIKGKIAAFFLRDVGAVLLKHNQIGKYDKDGVGKYFIFMQPIDIWLREMVIILNNSNIRFVDLSDVPRKFAHTLAEGKRDCKRIKWILGKCRYYMGIGVKSLWELGSNLYILHIYRASPMKKSFLKEYDYPVHLTTNGAGSD